MSNQTKRGLGRALTILSIFGFIFCVFTIPRLSLDGTGIIFMTVYSILVCGAIFYLGYRLQHVKTKAKVAESKLEKQRGAQMVSIIKYEGSENVCVWRHPAKTVTTGSLLMIKPPFEAVIMQQGVPVARYPSSSAIAINARNLSRPYFTTDPDEDYETDCEIYFVNMAYMVKLEWHNDNSFPCYVSAQVKCKIGATGTAKLKINDAARFVAEIYSCQARFETPQEAIDAVISYFNGIGRKVVAREFSKMINNGRYELVTVETNKDILAKELYKNVMENLIISPDFGLALDSLTIDRIVNISDIFAVFQKTPDEQAENMQKVNEQIPANIVIEVDDIIAKEFPPEKYMLGMCHAIWHRAKELYAERGYTWYSPQDIHPLWTFD